MPLEIPARPSASTAPARARRAPGLNMEIRFGAPRVTLQQRIAFTERLVLLLDTGVSLFEALKAMQLQPDSPLVADIIGSVADTISEGKSFSHALSLHPQMFSSTYVSLVGAAEEGGFLPKVLAQLQRMDEKNAQMNANLKAALSYPLLLVAFSALVVVFVLVFIFPKFQDLFASIRDQLPVTTLFLMSLSDLLRHHWLVVCAGLGLAAWVIRHWAISERGRLALDRARMRLPVVREIYTQIYLSRTLSVLGLSLSSGVPITLALRASQDVVRNVVFAGFLESLKQHVNEGRGIAVGFTTSPLVPPLVQQMITTGEQTGTLGMVMTRVADFYDRELTRRVAVLSKAIEPIMLVVMGIVVGLIVVSLILPIFKLSRAIH